MSFDRAEFITLLISIAIETLIVGIWGKLRQLDWRLLALVAVASTLITHPILWQVFNDLLPKVNLDRDLEDRFNYLALLLEIPVVLAEGIVYKWVMKYSWRSSMTISLMANLTSYLMGLWLVSLAYDR
ncbi:MULTISPECIES: hypothetical protein [unclassified Chamaesiphon]|uniref:hypothetical protein n=1 Tax=unclassified Chamaesiphon TaxID=2620921 RepID=UPI00286CD7EE|nr:MULTISPECIES: hypothetical protein [unclassified Chamaesiphon]